MVAYIEQVPGKEQQLDYFVNRMDTSEFFLRHYNLAASAYPELYDASGGDNIGGNIAVANDNKEDVANDVDNFRDNFLLVANDTEGEINGEPVELSQSIGELDQDLPFEFFQSLGEFDENDEELAWLQDPNAFLAVSADHEVGGMGMHTSESPSQAHPEVTEHVHEQEEIKNLVSDGAMADVSNTPSPGLTSSDPTEERSTLSSREQLRRLKVARYLEKKKRRQWSRTAPYKSRQVVANSRPRHKGRFLPLESEFVPIAELQRRQRASFKQQQEQQGVN